MTTLKTLLLAAALVAPAAANAQVGGIAVANPEAAIANSRAWATARGQIQTTYKTQLDQADARRRAIQTELQPLVTAYQTAAGAPGATEASLRPQAQAIQTRENNANQELARLTGPAQRAQAYALEQISGRLKDAIDGAGRARNASLVLRPDAALSVQPAADITAAVTTELDRLVPTVSIAPPANWQPGQAGQGAGAAPAGAPPRAPAAASRRQPSGR